MGSTVSRVCMSSDGIMDDDNSPRLDALLPQVDTIDNVVASTRLVTTSDPNHHHHMSRHGSLHCDSVHPSAPASDPHPVIEIVEHGDVSNRPNQNPPVVVITIGGPSPPTSRRRTSDQMLTPSSSQPAVTNSDGTALLVGGQLLDEPSSRTTAPSSMRSSPASRSIPHAPLHYSASRSGSSFGGDSSSHVHHVHSSSGRSGQRRMKMLRPDGGSFRSAWEDGSLRPGDIVWPNTGTPVGPDLGDLVQSPAVGADAAANPLAVSGSHTSSLSGGSSSIHRTFPQEETLADMVMREIRGDGAFAEPLERRNPRTSSGSDLAASTVPLPVQLTATTHTRRRLVSESTVGATDVSVSLTHSSSRLHQHCNPKKEAQQPPEDRTADTIAVMRRSGRNVFDFLVDMGITPISATEGGNAKLLVSEEFDEGEE